MKTRWKTIAVIGTVIIAACWLRWLIVVATSTVAKDFCTAKPGFMLSKLELHGHGRTARVTDKQILEYLVLELKLHQIPTNRDNIRAITYEAKAFNLNGVPGTVEVYLESDKAGINFGYFEAPNPDPNLAWMGIGSNAPAKLFRLLDFLLSDENSGEEWKE